MYSIDYDYIKLSLSKWLEINKLKSDRRKKKIADPNSSKENIWSYIREERSLQQKLDELKALLEKM